MASILTPNGYPIPVLHIAPSKGDERFELHDGKIIHLIFDGKRWNIVD